MNKELETKLIERFPGIFIDMYGNPMETCMAGCECGDGWYDLIFQLCENIEKVGPANFKALQVKEKFGGLRFYYGGGNEEIYRLVSDAIEESYKICEQCGTQENVTTACLTRCGTTWILTLCQECREKK